MADSPTLAAQVWLNQLRLDRLNRKVDVAPPSLPIYPWERPKPAETIFDQLNRQQGLETLRKAMLPVSGQAPAPRSVSSVPWRPVPLPGPRMSIRTMLPFEAGTARNYPSEKGTSGDRFPGGPLGWTKPGFEAAYTGSEYLRFVKENKRLPWWGPIRSLADVEANLNSDLAYYQHTPALPPTTRQIAVWNISTAILWVREQRVRGAPRGADPIPFAFPPRT